MSFVATNRLTDGNAAEPCPCGCAPCETLCCRLECLEQPRFYCGQLLTDQDLTGLVDWAQGKFGLKRFLQGWGVVCGLEVRCDPQRPGHVVVSPGYAVDCCGNDIIVCEEAYCDLSGLCPDLSQPCEELEGTGEGTTQDPRFVDLYLGYAEKDAAPRAAFGRSECRDVERCEPSRIKESYELHARKTVPEYKPMDWLAEEWERGYRERLKDVLKHFVDLMNLEDPTTVKKLFLDWLTDKPLHNFCFLRDRVCGMDTKDERIKLLLWLVQDTRMAFFHCDCHECSDDPGVPLARIVLKAFNQQGARRCGVQAIDAYPPYRRPLKRECWPAPFGEVNLGQFVWHRVEEACIRLRAMGIYNIEIVKIGNNNLPNDLNTLRAMMAQERLFAGCNEHLKLVSFDPSDTTPYPYPAGDRVVGFQIGDTPEGQGVYGAVVSSPTNTGVTAGAKKVTKKRVAKKS